MKERPPIRRKLIGEIYPTRHPLFLFYDSCLGKMERLFEDPSQPQDIGGNITGTFVKKKNRTPATVELGITNFLEYGLNHPDTIGKWFRVRENILRMEVDKQDRITYWLDLSTKQIKMTYRDKESADSQFKESFGYFIIEDAVIENDQPIPECDAPGALENKKRVRIGSDDLHGGKNGNSGKDGKAPIKINLNPPAKEENSQSKIQISKEDLPTVPPKDSPFDIEEYDLWNSSFYNNCLSAIMDASGSVRPPVLKEKMRRFNHIDYKTSPFFIFIDRKVEKRMKGDPSQYHGAIGLLKGGGFQNPGETPFLYLEIEDATAAEDVDGFEFNWSERLDRLFDGLDEQSDRQVIGWFMQFQRKMIEDTNRLMKLVIKWIRRRNRGNLFVGIVMSDRIIAKGEPVNIISFNKEADKEIFHGCDHIYSFKKDNV
jgi:hypothetical protein